MYAKQLYENGILSIAVGVNDDECSSISRPLWIIGVVIGGVLLLVAVFLVVGYFLHKGRLVKIFYSMLWSPEGSGHYRRLDELDRSTVL